MKPYQIRIYWSCGVRPFCEHKTKIGAWIHGLIANIAMPFLRR